MSIHRLDHRGRNADRDGAGGDGLGDDRPGSDDGALADVGRRKQNEERIRENLDRLLYNVEASISPR
jgi:hypothetical protein